MASSRRPRRKPKGGGPAKPQLTHTSMSTGRAAYADTRQWLLKSHGPVCAYCGVTFPAKTLTLDHVTPRRGQSAFDRRDNLVLCCKRCNTAKADKSFLAWVLGSRVRARHLYLYGQHLSDGILDMLRPMVGHEVTLPPPKPAAPAAPRAKRRTAREIFGAEFDDGTSPYYEVSPYDEPAPTSAATASRRSPAAKASGPAKAAEAIQAAASPAKKRTRRGGVRHKK